MSIFSQPQEASKKIIRIFQSLESKMDSIYKNAQRKNISKKEKEEVETIRKDIQ